MTVSDIMERLAEVLDLPVFRLGDEATTVASLLMAVLVVLGALIAAKVAGRAFRSFLSRRGNVDEDAAGAMVRVIFWLILIPAMGVALDLVGFNLSAIFAAGGLFALAIGFALKNVAENFISGLILQSERTIRRGDILEVDGRLLRVRDIGIRTTIARGRDDEDVVLPNSQLVQASVTNFTLNRDSLRRIRTTVGVAYSSDMQVVETTLMQVATELSWRSPERDPRVIMTEFGTSSVDFQVSIWIDDPWNAGRLRGELNRAIWWALKEAGITIAFPQLDLHLDPGATEADRRG